jgi:hypothetical protein
MAVVGAVPARPRAARVLHLAYEAGGQHLRGSRAPWFVETFALPKHDAMVAELPKKEEGPPMRPGGGMD